MCVFNLLLAIYDLKHPETMARGSVQSMAIWGNWLYGVNRHGHMYKIALRRSAGLIYVCCFGWFFHGVGIGSGQERREMQLVDLGQQFRLKRDMLVCL